jgi:hypothetical protein
VRPCKGPQFLAVPCGMSDCLYHSLSHSLNNLSSLTHTTLTQAKAPSQCNAEQVKWIRKERREDRRREEIVCGLTPSSNMEGQGKGAIWADSHYLPFPRHFGYLLRFCQIHWINIPSERYLVTPAIRG